MGDGVRQDGGGVFLCVLRFFVVVSFKRLCGRRLKLAAVGGGFAASTAQLRAKAEKLEAKAFKNAADGFKLRAELPRSLHRERGCGQRSSNSRQGKTN